MRHVSPFLLACVQLSPVLLGAVAPVFAQHGPEQVDLHQAFEDKQIAVETVGVSGYQAATVRITNNTDKPLDIDPVGSGLVPTEPTNGKYTQRLALMGERFTIAPGGQATIRFRTCCMDLGKPAPSTPGPYTDVVAVDARIAEAMRFWQQQPQITQNAINRVVWGMHTLDDLVTRFGEGNCPINRPGTSDPIQTEYPQDALEWHAEQERFIREAEDMVARSERNLSWTELLVRAAPGETGEGALEGDIDPEGDLPGSEGEEGEEVEKDLGKALAAQFEKAAKEFKVVVLYVFTDATSERYDAIRETCTEFEYAVLRDESVFKELESCVRLKVDVAELSPEMARQNNLSGRRAPQLLVFDYEGKLRYRVQSSRPSDAVNKITRTREICERMFKRDHD